MSPEITTSTALAKGLQAAGTENTRAVIQNPELFGFILSNFNNTLKQ